jgi:hypothetical protein
MAAVCTMMVLENNFVWQPVPCFSPARRTKAVASAAQFQFRFLQKASACDFRSPSSWILFYEIKSFNDRCQLAFFAISIELIKKTAASLDEKRESSIASSTHVLYQLAHYYVAPRHKFCLMDLTVSKFARKYDVLF